MKKKDSFKTSDKSNLPKFLGGATTVEQVQALRQRHGVESLPIVAFAGKSNVGKSSLLNALTGCRIARVSQKPGKTTEMNLFYWSGFLLLDLPGYGFAKVSKDLRESWGKGITDYLKKDEALRLVVCLADGRHGFSADDVELQAYLKKIGALWLVAFTKMDKYKSSNQKAQALRDLEAVCHRAGVEHFVLTSAESREGLENLKNRIITAIGLSENL